MTWLPDARAHLGYCTNVHAGGSLTDVTRHITEYVAPVAQKMGATEPFGVGLRLSAEAARALRDPVELARFQDTLLDANCYIFTLNGFPYGNFHQGRVKEDVYLPDWTDARRAAYTRDLAHVLAELVPAGGFGSISTVPGCFRPRATPEAIDQIRVALLAQAAELWRLRETTGRHICLALEPEPHCMLETTAECVSFLQESLFGRESVLAFARVTGQHQAQSEAALREHLGVCLDACHAAVEFEDPQGTLHALSAADIRIAKAQLSVALRCETVTDAARAKLAELDEPTYLHQVVTKQGSHLQRYVDLQDALVADRKATDHAEWRVHFHVPIFRDVFRELSTTQGYLQSLLALHRQRPFTTHLEVETYTWGVLGEPGGPRLVELLAEELAWAHSALTWSPGAAPQGTESP